MSEKKEQIAQTGQFCLASSPHYESPQSVPQIMWTVVLALVPCIVAGGYFFGFWVLVTIAVSVVTAVATEELINKMRKRKPSYRDGSAVITGIILALTLPPSLSPFFAILGAIVAIGIGKGVFGGLGHNIFNPALIGRAFLQASFPIQMTAWTAPKMVDAVSTATPLGSFKFEKVMMPYFDSFVGNIGGCIGETSALAILVGGGYLLYKKAADWRIPVSLIGTVACLSTIFWLCDSSKYPDPFFQVIGGSLLFGAFFMATDMVTSPVTVAGSWVFGIGAGLLIVTIRLFGGLPEGVMFSLLLMNACTPLINKFTRPRYFGERK